MKGFEVEVGGDDFESMGGGALQGGINTGAVNCAAIAEESHGLLAFGTSIGTVELWDSRSRNRVSALGPPASLFSEDGDARPEITALDFHRSGLNLATGSSNGIVHTYDLRSPVPLLRKDQGYEFPIQTLKYLTPSTSRQASSSEQLLSADKRVIKLWDSQTGDQFTSIEPVVDLNHVEWVPDSGMFLTANEGRQQHAFFIPTLGPAPRWCSFLDNLVEEMAEDAEDPNSFKNGSIGGAAGEVYENYKFLDMAQLRELSLDHLIGQTNLLRPYMHGYFVAQQLWEQAKVLANPDMAEQERQKSIQARIDKERESRIRGNKKVAIKVNRRLAEKLAAREEANERRKAQRVLKQGGDEPQAPTTQATDAPAAPVSEDRPKNRLLEDDRFARLFEDEEFEIDETSREFAMLNPSTVPVANPTKTPRRLTAVEEIEMQDHPNSDDDDNDDDDEQDSDEEAEAAALQARRSAREDERSDRQRIGSVDYKRGGSKKPNKFKTTGQQQGPSMRVTSSNPNVARQKERQGRTFGDLAQSMPSGDRSQQEGRGGLVGEKEVTFAPAQKPKKRVTFDSERSGGPDNGRRQGRGQDRRSASGNTFRRM